MMTLKTICRTTEESHVQVFWSMRRDSYNLLNIQIPRSVPDRRIVAELIAIRYLVMEKKVFGSVPESSKSMRLIVSSGAIRKLALRRTRKSNIIPYGSFLLARLDGVDVQVQHKWDTIDEVSAEACPGSVESIRPSLKKYSVRTDAVSTPKMGDLHITYHAAKRYMERTEGFQDDENVSRAWSRLAKRVQHANWEPKELPDKVLNYKLRRYAKLGLATVWGMLHSDLNLVVVTNNEGISTLVTVYYRASSMG